MRLKFEVIGADAKIMIAWRKRWKNQLVVTVLKNGPNHLARLQEPQDHLIRRLIWDNS